MKLKAVLDKTESKIASLKRQLYLRRLSSAVRCPTFLEMTSRSTPEAATAVPFKSRSRASLCPKFRSRKITVVYVFAYVKSS